MSKFCYVTTPIYYVNDKPHIGHVYTSIACDIIARFKRMNNYNVLFLTGTDEHGQKVEKSALNKNILPQDFVDTISQSFKDLTPLLNLTNDDFIRTTEDRHKVSVQAFWKKIEDNGYIYKDNYSGWYSVREEAFYTEEDLIKTPKGDLITPSGDKVEWREEESYFFKLSIFQEKLLDYYNNNKDFIQPASRFNEILSFVKRGLKDLSISRTSIKWGVPVINDTSHVVYVWLDALTNYITALGYPNIDKKFESYWKNSIHIIGKDIIRFHAIYWPAFLMAANISLPKKMFAHGWWLNEGEKISKSLGNTIDSKDLINTYGLDEVRYFLFREIPFGNDGDFSHNAIINRINKDLANDYGNLIQRSLSMLNKSFNSEIVTHNFSEEQNNYIRKIKQDKEILSKYIENQEFSKYLEYVWSIIRYANQYLNISEPWKLIKENNHEKAGEILSFIIDIVRIITIYLHPFTPNKSDMIFNQLQYIWDGNINSLSDRLKEGHKLGEASPVFNKFL